MTQSTMKFSFTVRKEKNEVEEKLKAGTLRFQLPFSSPTWQRL